MIADFWLSHPEYWITPPHRVAAVDAELLERFRDVDVTRETLLGCVIYVDQLGRHFCRAGALSEEMLAQERAAIVAVLERAQDTLLEAQENELIWFLMPFKHIKKYDHVFQTISQWLLRAGGALSSYPLLHRFFADTFRKATAAPLPVLCDAADAADAADVCEHYVRDYRVDLPIPDSARPLRDVLGAAGKRIAVSLSGGVDSMLMCALLARSGADVVAIHIVYGNREVSAHEYSVVAEYCRKLGVPLYIYHIPYIRRGAVDREFYETETRRLRFACYRALDRPVLLGHIYEDVVENVWTNFATGKHLDDLVKIKTRCVEDGVTIVRPWLDARKSTIYEVARALAIPWLLNTTPEWSNRGKFRGAFYAATHAQYGAQVDDVVVGAANRLAAQAALLERVFYAPIFATWCPTARTMDVSRAVDAALDVEGWHVLLRWLAYTCGKKKPSHDAVADFKRRVARRTPQTFHLNKDLCIRYEAGRITVRGP
jgi:tRNA(Ile)-lysidine synthase TilS/MesJ